jgi:hypothetical protein
MEITPGILDHGRGGFYANEASARPESLHERCE